MLVVYSTRMEKKKIEKRGKQIRKTEVEWTWQKNYWVWDANRKIFIYPENWIERDLRLPARFRVPLSELALFIRPRCGAKGVRILLTGKVRARRLVATQTLAHNLGTDLYQIDLSAVVSELGEMMYDCEHTASVSSQSLPSVGEVPNTADEARMVDSVSNASTTSAETAPGASAA